MTAEATPAERAAVDAALDEHGALRAPLSDRSGHPHVAHGGFHLAKRQRHLLLPVLLSVQDAVGWVSQGALSYLSEQLAIPPADAYGVATFYALISTEEAPERLVHVCDDIACLLAGADDITRSLQQERGPAHSGDERGWAPSPCLGQCELAPAAFIQHAGRPSETAVQITPAIAAELVDGGAAALPSPAMSIPRPEGMAGTEGLTNASPLLHRIGLVDPSSLGGYEETGGYRALRKALEMGREAVIDEVEASGVRGRGGAAFPMGVKWRGAAGFPGPRYVICNADESEPGTFKDKVLLEGDPFTILEAMTIAGYAIGSNYGYLYVRGEYPRATSALAAAAAQARSAGWLGEDIGGTGFDFDIEIRRGGGAYICGEETALFNSIEGHRGEPRQKPPFPTEAGLFGRPTVVNNVETLANVPRIILGTGASFAEIGSEQSTGTKLFCVSGHVARPGVYEVDFGATTADLLELAGGVDGSLVAALLGGAAGAFIGPDQLDVPLTFEDARDAEIPIGSGVIMAFNESTDFSRIVARIAEFFRDESCGQCVPCRVGTVRQEESLHLMLTNGSPAVDDGQAVSMLSEIDQVMRDASICGLGQTAGSAIQSALRLGLIGGTS